MVGSHNCRRIDKWTDTQADSWTDGRLLDGQRDREKQTHVRTQACTHTSNLKNWSLSFKEAISILTIGLSIYLHIYYLYLLTDLFSYSSRMLDIIKRNTRKKWHLPHK